MPRRPMARRVMIGVAVVLLVGAAAVVGFRLHTVHAVPVPAADLPPATATITRQTLVDTTTNPGTLGYGRTMPVAVQLSGIVTALPEVDATVARGGQIYAVNDRPVVLMYGTLPAYRALSAGEKGPDVRQLEENLTALGYRGFTVDDDFTAATATEVRHWQRDLGLPQTGTVDLGRVVFTPAGIRVASETAAVGGSVAPGQVMLEYTYATRVITVDLDPSDQRLAVKGGKVAITMPEGSTFTGTVTNVSTVITPDPSGGNPQTKVEVTVSLTDPAAQKAAAGYDDATVDATFTASERKNVLTVPVAALVALAEGGYGVQVVAGTSARYVPVETGLFAGGQVEISGAGIAAGMVVGMPQ